MMRTEVETAGANRVERVRELERFALERLPSLQLADGIFCHELRAEEGRPQGRSPRYTLIVLLGLQRAEEHGIEHPFDLGALRSRILSELESPELTAGDMGLALWAESRSEGDAARELVRALQVRLERSGIERLSSMEVAWIVTGLTEAGARGELRAGEAILAECRAQLIEERRPSAGLVTHFAQGLRRRLSNFPDQIYSLVALSALAQIREDGNALDAARSIGNLMLEIQMPDAAWPMIYDPIRGTVIEPYEKYSVHQDSMALLGMYALSEATGDRRYRDAAVQGLDWNYGENELGVQMFDREAGMIYRSIRRKKRFAPVRRARHAAVRFLRTPPRSAAPKELEVNRALRPYHLGWLLEVWASREELALNGD